MATSVTCLNCQNVTTYEPPLAQISCQFCGAPLVLATPEDLTKPIDLPNLRSVTTEQPPEISPPRTARKPHARNPLEPPDETSDLPRAHSLPYERHRRELDKPAAEEPTDALTVDPARWNPVRIGLTVVFWSWVTILAMIGLFTVLWLCVFFKITTDDALIRTWGWVIKSIALVGILASLVGQCLCIGVPKPARARAYIIGSVVGMLAFASCVVMFLVVPKFTPPGPPFARGGEVNKAPFARGGEGDDAPVTKGVDVPKDDVPKDEVPKGEVPDEAPKAADDDGGKVEPPAPRQAPAILNTQLPGMAIPKANKLWISAAYLVSQILFILFLKRVALFFHDLFLAESTGGYITLLTLHAGIIAFLPPEALIACFFWVILLALEFMLVVWFLLLIRGTRKDLG